MQTKHTILRVSSLDSPGSLQNTSSPKHTVAQTEHLVPGCSQEEAEFRKLYDQLPVIWKRLGENTVTDEVVVVVPSLSLDPDELVKITGIEFYEERLLFLLILLSNPRTEVVFVTSLPLRERIIDYYLQLLPGVPYSHARRRLHLFSTEDGSRDKSLTQKVLERPALIQRIKNCYKHAEVAHLTVFNATSTEKSLSVALGIPLMGADPRHLHFGTKSGARKLFRETGVLFPDGYEDLKSAQDIAESIVDLFQAKPELKRVVIKLNDGFSGEGNAIYPLTSLIQASSQVGLTRQEAVSVVLDTLPTLTKMQAANLSWESFAAKFEQMQGVVEEFIEGVQKQSPSVQTRLTPLGETQIISTHDQIMGGDDGQVFLGCRFPASPPFHEALHQGAMRIGPHLVQHGLVERVSIDYLAVPNNPQQTVSLINQWKLYAIEINLRKGGTTHPFRTLQFLTGGHYTPDTGLFTTSVGIPKYYVASDNLVSKKYKGLLPEDLIDITTYNRLHYSSATHTGVIFHMIGAMSEHGKVGITCIGNTPHEAQQLYDKTIAVLDAESQTTRWLA